MDLYHPYPSENLRFLHMIFQMPPYLNAKTWKFCSMGQMRLDHWWQQWHQMLFVRDEWNASSKSTWATRPRPIVDEIVNYWKFALGWLRFDIVVHPILLPLPCGLSWALCVMSNTIPQLQILLKNINFFWPTFICL